MDERLEIMRKALSAKGRPPGVATVYDANPQLRPKFDAVLLRCRKLADAIDEAGRRVARGEATVEEFRAAVREWYRAVMDGFRKR